MAGLVYKTFIKGKEAGTWKEVEAEKGDGEGQKEKRERERGFTV